MRSSRVKKGDAMGRSTCESSLPGAPDAKFFCGKPAALKKSAHDAERQIHFANAGSVGVGAGEGAPAAPPLPLQPHPGSIFGAREHEFESCTMRTVRTGEGMLHSHLGTRTQTPSSSPDPF